MGPGSAALAQASLSNSTSTAAGNVAAVSGEFLDPAIAFPLRALALNEHTVRLHFDIAPGYYLYRDNFRFEAAVSGSSPSMAKVVFDPPAYPPSVVKFDPTFQRDMAIYRTGVDFDIPVRQAPARFTLEVTSQGCADAGLCYPPRRQTVQVSLRGFGGDGSAEVQALPSLRASTASGIGPNASRARMAQGSATESTQGLLERLERRVGNGTVSPSVPSVVVPQEDRMSRALAGDFDAALQGWSLGGLVLVFLLLGVTLSLTPCVLPMVPIVARIVLGSQPNVGASALRWQGLRLALLYCLGMSLVYTALGVVAAQLGQSLGAWLQTPWLLWPFAVLLVLLASTQFGWWHLQLPASLRQRLDAWAQGLDRRSRLARASAVFLLGAISALLVGPCVTAPLAGVLLFIARTQDVVTGGLALFALAWGMSVPLLLLGAFGPRLLPQRGAWMVTVQHAFGWLLLGTALWVVTPLLRAPWSLLVWALLAAALGVALWSMRAGGRVAFVFSRTLGLLSLAWAAALTVGAWGGAQNLLRPLQPFTVPRAGVEGRLAGSLAQPVFAPIKTSAQLDEVIRASQQPVVLDFYADWCVSCKEMEAFTFPQPEVAQRLGQWRLLRADVTANDADDQALLKRFALFGPPGIIFLREGREVGRVVGYQNAADFAASLDKAQAIR